MRAKEQLRSKGKEKEMPARKRKRTCKDNQEQEQEQNKKKKHMVHVATRRCLRVVVRVPGQGTLVARS